VDGNEERTGTASGATGNGRGRRKYYWEKPAAEVVPI